MLAPKIQTGIHLYPPLPRGPPPGRQLRLINLISGEQTETWGHFPWMRSYLVCPLSLGSDTWLVGHSNFIFGCFFCYSIKTNLGSYLRSLKDMCIKMRLRSKCVQIYRNGRTNIGPDNFLFDYEIEVKNNLLPIMIVNSIKYHGGTLRRPSSRLSWDQVRYRRRWW